MNDFFVKNQKKDYTKGFGISKKKDTQLSGLDFGNSTIVKKGPK